MKLVVFGLSISSSWGNGHATVWRGLCRALGAMGHDVLFFERDTPYYAAHRDVAHPDGCRLLLYGDWPSVLARAERAVADADVAIVTSYCPDAIAATELVVASDATRVFYDLDAPVTLERIAAGEAVEYVGPRGLRDFDLVMSFTGGRALVELRARLGARRTVALYGSVDPRVHSLTRGAATYSADLSYLGTYAADRQPTLARLFLEPARLAPHRRFIIGGSLYPSDFPWRENVWYVRHVAPPEHAAFYGSSSWTLNVTRRAMAEFGHCPSGRLFEAAACGVPIVSDDWSGLDTFFEPGREIVVARTPEDVVRALGDASARNAIAAAARARVLAEHTASRRARQLVAYVTGKES